MAVTHCSYIMCAVMQPVKERGEGWQQWEHAAVDGAHSKSSTLISSVARKTASHTLLSSALNTCRHAQIYTSHILHMYV